MNKKTYRLVCLLPPMVAAAVLAGTLILRTGTSASKSHFVVTSEIFSLTGRADLEVSIEMLLQASSTTPSHTSPTSPTPFQEAVPAIAALTQVGAEADLEGLLLIVAPFGGRIDPEGAARMREHWRRGPAHLEPAGWRTWSDEQVVIHLYRTAKPWKAIDLSSFRITEARRRDDGQIDPRSSRVPFEGDMLRHRFIHVPDLDRALSSGARAILLEFDFLDAEGVQRTAAIWLCELSPGLWCLAGSRISGEQRPGEFIL